MLLDIPYNLTKEIKYFSFFKKEIVTVNIELFLYLNSLIFKNRVYFIIVFIFSNILYLVNVGMYILEYMDRSYMVTCRRRVVVVSLISHPYGN